MPTIINLSPIWEHTLMEILNHGNPTIYERSQKKEFICIRPLSATPTCLATPRCDHLCVVNSTKVVHMNSTKVVVHGKVVTHSGVATNSTCVSGAPHSHLNSRSSSDSRSSKRRLELQRLLV